MSYHKRGSSGYLVARRQGNYPVQVVHGTHYPSKKRAQKKADQLNKAYEGSDINSWFERKAGEENAGTHRILFFYRRTLCQIGSVKFTVTRRDFCQLYWQLEDLLAHILPHLAI
jgi:hypothetical protein